MSESMMDCPNCGRSFPTRLQELSENGNPICPECKAKEQAKLEAETK